MDRRFVFPLAVLSVAGVLAIAAPTSSAIAQSNPPHPEAVNVIPDGGHGGIEGKVHAVDPHSRTITIVAKNNYPVEFYVDPQIRMDNIKVGDEVDALFTRTVLWVVTPAGQASLPGQTTNVAEAMHTPGGVGPSEHQINGRVVKIDSDNHRFDVVDATGGGVYTVVVTHPARYAMMDALKTGSGITVLLSPLTITSMEECGFFGCL